MSSNNRFKIGRNEKTLRCEIIVDMQHRAVVAQFDRPIKRIVFDIDGAKIFCQLLMERVQLLQEKLS